MEKEFYRFGISEDFQTESELNYRDSRDAVIGAVSKGLGFIVRHYQSEDKKARRAILGWNIKVLSYDEAFRRYEHNPKMLRIVLDSEEKDVFVVSPSKEGEIVFPFKADSLTVVDMQKLL